MSDASIRIDKWLWQARFCKTRGLASTLVSKGKLRVDGDRITKPGRAVRAGQVLTFPFQEEIYVVEILALGTRRGPYSEARGLYRVIEPHTQRENLPLNAEESSPS